MDEPEKDSEFAVYFSPRWSDLLKLTLQNFLSIVLSTSPPPKLLILEKWYRSEAQQEIRTQLRLSAKKIDALIERVERYETRLQVMREAIKSLVHCLQKVQLSGLGNSNKKTNVFSGSLFETDDEEAEKKREKAREIGQLLLKVSTECAKRNSGLGSVPPLQRQKEILGAEYNALNFNEIDMQRNQIPSQSLGSNNHHHNTSSNHSSNNNSSNILSTLHSPRELEDMENELINKINLWLSLLTYKS
jgi:hypothetical protein